MQIRAFFNDGLGGVNATKARKLGLEVKVYTQIEQTRQERIITMHAREKLKSTTQPDESSPLRISEKFLTRTLSHPQDHLKGIGSNVREQHSGESEVDLKLRKIKMSAKLPQGGRWRVEGWSVRVALRELRA